MKSGKRGIALPLVFGAILCLAVWVASLSFTVSNSRFRFTQAVKVRRAYFMARSALQHFFVKIKTMQKTSPEAMNSLYNAKPEDWGVLSKAFLEDIIAPPDALGELQASYKIASFSIDAQDPLHGEMCIQIVAEGMVDGVQETIKRVYKVTR
ncbi:MAG: hypothetical protein HQM08_10520 [Candidatus Riflebacteria bacterium]|nr:hypothetical protein [Candidatus Riflebacteria bacterium]